MKGLGAVLVLAACTGFGLAFADYQKRRLRMIQMLKRAIVLLRGQILYANAPIGEGLRDTGIRLENAVGSFFLEVSRRIEEGDGVSLKKIWEEELEKMEENWALEKQELADFRQFGGELGYLDLAMQEKTLNLYLEKLELAEKTLLGNLDAKVRLSASLGILSGVFLVIVLI